MENETVCMLTNNVMGKPGPIQIQIFVWHKQLYTDGSFELHRLFMVTGPVLSHVFVQFCPKKMDM